MQNTSIFSSRSGDYQKGRAGYAPDAIRLLLDLLVPHKASIADIGSGTGLLARDFLEAGHHAWCVEPSAPMRAKAEAALGEYETFHSIAGDAERTNLPNASVQMITAASAFHWFDPIAFRIECQRILAPNGYVALLFHARDYDQLLTIKQHEICRAYCEGFTSLRHGLDQSQHSIEQFFGSQLHHAEFNYPLPYTKQAFINRCLSSSYAPAQGHANRQPYIDDIRALLDELYAHDDFLLDNKTVLYWGKLR